MLAWNIIALLIISAIYFYGKSKNQGGILRGVLWGFLFWHWLNSFVFGLDGWVVIGCNGIFIAVMLVVYSSSVSKRKVE
jgi:hypothetical protein